MKQAYAHEAHLILEGDDRAPGGAITSALCGALDHQPPCPLASHHIDAVREGEGVRLRILFAVPPNKVDEVRTRIDNALAAGVFTGPDGTTTHWRTLDSGCTRITREEFPHARRLL